MNGYDIANKIYQIEQKLEQVIKNQEIIMNTNFDEVRKLLIILDIPELSVRTKNSLIYWGWFTYLQEIADKGLINLKWLWHKGCKELKEAMIKYNIPHINNYNFR